MLALLFLQKKPFPAAYAPVLLPLLLLLILHIKDETGQARTLEACKETVVQIQEKEEAHKLRGKDMGKIRKKVISLTSSHD